MLVKSNLIKKIARNISVSKYLQSPNFFDTSPIAEKKQQIRTRQSVVSWNSKCRISGKVVHVFNWKFINLFRKFEVILILEQKTDWICVARVKIFIFLFTIFVKKIQLKNSFNLHFYRFYHLNWPKPLQVHI